MATLSMPSKKGVRTPVTPYLCHASVDHSDHETAFAPQGAAFTTGHGLLYYWFAFHLVFGPLGFRIQPDSVPALAQNVQVLS